jgi:imidazolonepropionase-like amidohydrolase
MASLQFTNVRIFDGVTDGLSEPSNVTVADGLITAITAITTGPTGPPPADTTVIDGKGRTLMPGLIDAHWHAIFVGVSPAVGLTSDVSYVHLISAQQAELTLLRGFTSVRDCGGPAFGLKRAIDEGIIRGPRIWPSGAMISQTSGHGDFRARHEVPRDPCHWICHMEHMGAASIADGVPEVLRATREQLMLGASQIKVMAGGGVASSYDPIDVTQYTEPEVRAAVEAAENWGTYVMVHAYTPRAVQQAIRAGVKSIEHGHLLDEETVAMMAEQGVWWSLQPFLASAEQPPLAPANAAKRAQVNDGTVTAYELARKHGVKMGFGTDLLFEPAQAVHQGSKLVEVAGMSSNFEALRTATSTNAELLGLSGERNPYPGALGVVRKGAIADLLLVNGNPLADIKLIADPDTNFDVIVARGTVVKGG